MRLEKHMEGIREVLEESRDYLAYSSPNVDEQFLRQKISQFLELKRLVEQKAGEQHGSA